jgi:hypothetical protein
MKRVILFLFALSTLAIAGMPPAKGCGPEDQNWAVQAKTLPDFQIPAPDDRHATIIYMNRAAIGYYNQVKVAVDGEWRAATARHSYAAFTVSPGDHNLCAATVHKFKVWIPLRADAGKIYFVSEMTPGIISRPALELLQEDNARAQMASLKVSLSHPKN